MRHENMAIQADGHEARLSTYILDNSPEIGIEKRPLVLICPGGGYGFTSSREAEPVAVQLMAMGIHACILWYTVAPARFPTALEQAARSVALVRGNADKWGVDTEKIAIMGFSAGGHLAASLGVFWSREFLAERTGLPSAAMMPNGMILSYPVITSGPFCHTGSFENLLGEKAHDAEARSFVSLETQVTKDTPRAFLWHTYEDPGVPVENSLLMMDALRKQGINFEAHIFPHGGHGLSLGTDQSDARHNPGATINTDIACWIGMAGRWVKSL